MPELFYCLSTSDKEEPEWELREETEQSTEKMEETITQTEKQRSMSIFVVRSINWASILCQRAFRVYGIRLSWQVELTEEGAPRCHEFGRRVLKDGERIVILSKEEAASFGGF